MDLNLFRRFWQEKPRVAVRPEQHEMRSAFDRLERLRAAMSGSGMGTFCWNIATNVVDCDDNLSRLLGVGVTASTLSFDEFLARVHPDDRKCVSEGCQRCASEGEFEQGFRTAEAPARWLLGKAKVVRSVDDGAPLYLTGGCVDISKRQQAENEWHSRHVQVCESEARLRALVQDSPLGILMMDLDGRPIFYNPKCEEIHGMTLAEARGTGWLQALHPEDRDYIAVSWREASVQRRSWAQTYRFLHRDGRIVWVSGRAGPMHVDREHVGFVGVLEDITSLKLAEEAVRRSEAKLRRIADSGMVGLFYWNVDGQIAEANDKFLQMLGYAREELETRGLNIRNLTPSRWHALDDEKLSEVMRKGVASPWEQEFFASNGAAVPVLLVEAMLEESDRRGIAICLDISERKMAEAERDRLLERERQARQQAERATRARDEMISIIAHDLRNPLQVLSIVLSGMLKRSTQNESAAQELLLLQRTANSMETLLSSLLDVSQIEAGTFVLRKGDVKVAELLSEVRELFEARARERSVALSCDVEADVSVVVGDRARLMQVLWNLVGNALKFTPPQGKVTLRARRDDDSLRLSVEDTGTGIPHEHLPHLFDRFWQGNRKSGIGAGLGLSIAKGIVEAHGGEIWVESRAGQGSRFHFTIPAGVRRDLTCK